MVIDKVTGQAVAYTADERAEALEVSLCALAASLGYTPVRAGRHYSLKEMDSLIIYNDRTWNRWSGKGSIHGGTQIDFIMAFGGAETPQQAIKRLIEFRGNSLDVKYRSMDYHPKDDNVKQPDKYNEMVLPPKNANYKRLYAYLMQTRGLSYDVVTDFVKRKLIYEDSVHHNIVYCGYDPQGNIRYAGMRGTADIYGKKFKSDVPGNNKNYGVNIVNKSSKSLLVFESVIDCMSYIDLYHDNSSNKLVLGMVEDNPLVQFLKDYNHIENILFCLDNDEAAKKHLYGERLSDGTYDGSGFVKKYESQGYLVDVIEPSSGKDFNEALLNMRNVTSEESCHRRKGR